MPPINEYLRARPGPPLRALVPFYSGYRQAGVAAGRHRGLPSPYLTLIFTLHEPLTVAEHVDPRQPPGDYDSLIGGLHTTPATIVHDGRQSGVQLAVDPLAARTLLGMPAAELFGTDLCACDVLGTVANEVHDRLATATRWRERFAILDTSLAGLVGQRAGPADEVSRAWGMLRASHGSMTVGELAADVGWSVRHLTRKFKAELGLSPKAAARIMRFDGARRELQRRAATGQRLELAGLAAQFGYYDQPHLNREFAVIAGCTPLTWLAEEVGNIQAEPPAEVADWTS